jgi:hypothetical protein
MAVSPKSQPGKEQDWKAAVPKPGCAGFKPV